MKKRGKVLRDTSAGPGLLMVEGQQYPFALEGVWKSEVAPRSGLVVVVEFDQGGQIVAIIAVPESQLAKEQAEAVMTVAKEKGAALASGLRTTPTVLRGPLRVRAFVEVRCPRTGKPFRCRIPR